MEYTRGIFTIDGLEGPYEGYSTGERWNGWACPVFERSVAERIAESYSTQGDRDGFESNSRAWYDPEADSFWVSDENDIPEDGPLAFGSLTIIVAGRPVEVYPFGTRYWTWEEA